MVLHFEDNGSNLRLCWTSTKTVYNEESQAQSEEKMGARELEEQKATEQECLDDIVVKNKRCYWLAGGYLHIITQVFPGARLSFVPYEPSFFKLVYQPLMLCLLSKKTIVAVTARKSIAIGDHFEFGERGIDFQMENNGNALGRSMALYRSLRSCILHELSASKMCGPKWPCYSTMDSLDNGRHLCWNGKPPFSYIVLV